MRKLLIILIVFCASTSFGQTYSYQFEGVLDAEKSASIESQFIATKLFGEVKFRAKDTKGEIWFTILPNTKKAEGLGQNYASIAKNILIDNNLQPIDLIELK